MFVWTSSELVSNFPPSSRISQSTTTKFLHVQFSTSSIIIDYFFFFGKYHHHQLLCKFYFRYVYYSNDTFMILFSYTSYDSFFSLFISIILSNTSIFSDLIFLPICKIYCDNYFIEPSPISM